MSARVAAGGMEETGSLSSDDQDGLDWVAGTATAGGWDLEAIEAIGVRFKKVSLVIRADQLMAAPGATGDDVFQAQVQLASLVVVRELSRAIFQSELAIDGANGDALPASWSASSNTSAPRTTWPTATSAPPRSATTIPRSRRAWWAGCRTSRPCAARAAATSAPVRTCS